MQRFAPLDWSVRLRVANPNYAPRTPLVRVTTDRVASYAEQRGRLAAQFLLRSGERAKPIQDCQS
jgi:hypothetical protein